VFTQHELLHHVVRWLPHDTLGASGVLGKAIEVGVHLDGISVSMLVVVTFVAFCVQVFSLGYMADEPMNDYGRYFTWQSLFLFAMNTLVIAPNLLQLFLGWELVGLVSYLLIGFYWKKPSAARAALKAFWVTKFADMGLVVGLIILFVNTGSFDWTTAAIPGANLIALCLFIAVMGKSAQFPLHIWLPDAMEGPTPVSALLHAATMVAAGVFLIVRAHPLFEQAADTRLMMAYVGSFTALFAACIAVVQWDIKKVLAYSTCSQLGYMVCALGAGSQVAGYFHLTTHAFFKALLFLGAGSLIHGVHSNDMRHMGGLLKKMPLTGWLFVLGAAALAGLPPFSGFFSKDLILEDVLHQHLIVPFVFLLAAAFLTALYMTRVISLALLGKPSEHAEHAHESGPSMAIPLVLLGVPAVLIGFFGEALSGLYTAPRAFVFEPVVGGSATAAALTGVVIGYVMYARGALAGLRGALAPLAKVAASGAVDAAFTFGYRRGLLGLAALVAWTDRYVIDGLVNLTGWIALELGGWIRPIQTGFVRHYVFVLVAAFLLVGAYGVFAAGS
jgi:NADH-quinone oxidoreductase subunit L